MRVDPRYLSLGVLGPQISRFGCPGSPDISVWVSWVSCTPQISRFGSPKSPEHGVCPCLNQHTDKSLPA
eukprot:4366492-Pyramimonas_sp.AAC.1